MSMKNLSDAQFIETLVIYFRFTDYIILSSIFSLLLPLL